VMSKTEREQMLLNLVRLRYVESPVFLDVTSVVNQYTLQGSLRGGFNWLADGGDTQNVGADASYTDRPTITYSPRRGEKFTRSLLRPIPPSSLFALAQAGWPIDFLCTTTTNSINGIHNRFGAGGRARSADPEFARLMTLLREVQASGATGIRIEKRDELDAAILFFTRGGSGEIDDKVREVKRLLKLDAGAREFHLTYGAVARNSREIAVLSRSLLEVMTEFSSFIEVPSEHVGEGRTYPQLAGEGGITPLLSIKSGRARDSDAATAVRHRGYWYWIDDRDYRSKLAFAYLLILSSLTETSSNATAPILTIPTG
jgi:hypothetical protein